VCAAGGMAVQRAVAERWKAATGVPIVEGYGLTETSPIAVCNALNIKDWTGNIGVPIPSTEVAILDDDGREMPLGEVGEICIRGPQVMKGYWNRPDETAKVFTADGWFRSGDMGFMDGRGSIKITDRKKDMIIVSGFNVYPNEVEDVVMLHPGVLETAAVGTPDEKSGEVVKIVVVSKDPALTEADLLAHCRKHLKAAVAGGAALQHAVAVRWQQVTGTRIAEGYGLTESSPVVCFNPIGGTQKADSIGIPAPSTEVRLVDDQGRAVPLGEPGELIVRGPQVMQGYWNRPDETAKTVKDGWLYTGDVAVMDRDGYFKIVDRKKDMILVSGFNVYPNEVEDAIAKMDEVLEVAVIGVPDARSGEAVRAYIVPQPHLAPAGLTEEQVRAHCRQLLTDYKLPKSVEFRTELPKTPIGKILRKDLKAEYRARGTPAA